MDLTLFHHDTERTFDQNGELRTIFAEGRAVTTSIFLTGNVGVWRGVDLWMDLPFHRLRFDNAGGERTSEGIGDPRLFVRVGPEGAGFPDWPVAVRGGVKLSGGRFDVDAEIIPLGEGQRDWELLLEAGRSFHPLPLWTMGWVGYRWREENLEARRAPGNERFWWWSLGGEIGSVGWRASLEGLSGDPWSLEGGIRPSSTRRALHQIFVDLEHPLGLGRVRLGTRIPVSGRNLPAGAALTAGYFFRWGG